MLIKINERSKQRQYASVAKTAEQIEAARKVAAANPTAANLTAYATMKRQARE
ncbi:MULTISPECIES: hypothetical protein [Paenibacillus]|uniref:hypothetical protein n=1 Tax=Paenibacillus TaxID=44249 RepID=UPI0015BAEE7D|nr:hypothetical protein [Paenibacillus odorifer]